MHRLRITIRGAVQGVGFRPFVYRLATELGLVGWVNNTTQGVVIEVEGVRHELENFLLRLDPEKPPRAFVQSLEWSFLDPVGYAHFEIRESDAAGAKTALILPDFAICPDCLRDIRDPANRRYRYPFTNCTHCGPRFSIIEALPYDRANTTMKAFHMCDACRAEYDDPRDRRFHAQPNACPQCGPQLELWNAAGKPLRARHEALRAAADAVRAGEIVAVKGLGGFHLIVDARSEVAVARLRWRKHREEKPLALMVPSLEAVRAHCEVCELEERLLASPESPIVLLRRRGPDIAPTVAPGNPYLGVMLPYTPLHYLLMEELGFPVVATSGNLSDEPICTDEREALKRLAGIADLFLVHNRPIARHVDDSIVRVLMGRELVLRRARGYAPLPVHLAAPAPPLLAVGAHLKNTVALASGQDVFISQHIGDLETAEAFAAFRRVVEDFERLDEVRPVAIACDAHPEYLSSKYAAGRGLRTVSVQHHFAHVLSCMAENELEEPVLGVAWDGTGYGLDGTIWGGEFLHATAGGFTRAAHLRTFRLPGGDEAVKRPRRTALGLLYEIYGEAVFEMRDLPPVAACASEEAGLLRTMLQRGLNAPRTSSAGRLFDAVAAIAGLRQEVKFEGQAAMELEFALDGAETDAVYEFGFVDEGGPLVVDWAPMVRGIVSDARESTPIGLISAKFHNTLAECVAAVARRLGEERVVLTGGCFQNRYLTERTVRRLRENQFRPYWHQRVPPNDGGIALGQLVAAAKEIGHVSGSSR
ncbi:MAG: carbamoyltransferase HypF [Verrucomicrobia bacterium]|nr:carbamoyltransferase HypF [Verrucomicrobiota bacterium]